MPSAVETCTCGASIVVEASMVTLIAGRLDEFRAAHSVCRERGPITQPEAADVASSAQVDPPPRAHFDRERGTAGPPPAARPGGGES